MDRSLENIPRNFLNINEYNLNENDGESQPGSRARIRSFTCPWVPQKRA
jgi:hypothetical protein